jgi:hypothetical protein
MDITYLNLNYICGRTVLSSGSNPGLVHDISNFVLRLLNDFDLTGKNQRLFTASQKFKRLDQLTQLGATVHNVPNYSLNIIKDLSAVLYNSMSQYR